MHSYSQLKTLFSGHSVDFWPALQEAVHSNIMFDELMALATMRKRAQQKFPSPQTEDASPIRVALIGGYSLYPLHELLELCLFGFKHHVQLWVGEYDNYMAEILDSSSELYAFQPDVVIMLPAQRRFYYRGALTDSHEAIAQQLDTDCKQVLQLAKTINEHCNASVIIGNFMPPAGHNLGAFRNKTLASDWSYTAQLNIKMGIDAPSYVHICDINFLASRMGLLAARDRRGWYESKQIGSADLLVAIAKESARIITSLRQSMKKVLVLDLDNTLWGGVIGDDGLEGIELGNTSPRGEAFKAFQRYALSLIERGVLLAVCSKNDYDKAFEPFKKHPEMVIKPDNIGSFKANWQPKSDNIRDIAQELNLGLDSFVFVDDNPAEINIVNQFLPQVSTILLTDDPSEYVAQLEDSRYFEPISITKEDSNRSNLYVQQVRYKELQSNTTDMASYLASLEMKATISEFTKEDAPRISQLINKSNQFNLTTKRRSESDVSALISSPAHITFTIRLADKFGDHGLIAVVIGEIQNESLLVDTWLMSCRVLKRQVEEETLNELIRIARLKNCTRIIGQYFPTAKNSMVKDHYATLGFVTLSCNDSGAEYEQSLDQYQHKETHINIVKHAYESSTSH